MTDSPVPRKKPRTKKEMVELIDDLLSESSAHRIRIDNQSRVIGELHAKEDATKREVIDRLGRDLDEARRQGSEYGTLATEVMRNLAAERAAHKRTLEQLANIHADNEWLKQCAFMDAAEMKEWKELARSSIRRHIREATIADGERDAAARAKPVERGPHAPVGARRTDEFPCGCGGQSSPSQCGAGIKHPIYGCHGIVAQQGAQCDACVLTF